MLSEEETDKSIDDFFERIRILRERIEREEADDKPYDASEYKRQEGGGFQKMIESSKPVILPEGVFNMLMMINNLQIPEDESDEDAEKEPDEFDDMEDLFDLIKEDEIPKDQE